MASASAKEYDYKTSWEKYTCGCEKNRFLSSDDEDLLKICDCIDLNSSSRKKTSGGIPIHYADGKIYVLKEGPHTRVEGESGSKKSRTVGRGSVITAILNHDSIIVTDPKGEICSDSKIQWLLKKIGVHTYILDFRNFDKDGYNPLSYTFELMKRGKRKKAMASIDKFVRMLKKSHEGADDPFWNGQGGDMIGFSTQNLAISLSQIEGGEQAFNLSSVKSFIRQDRDQVQSIFSYLADKEPMCNSITGYNDILQLGAEKTYSCIVSSANALLSEFASSDELLRMLSVQTFDIRTFYATPCALFLVVPDEHEAYNMLSGYLVDQLYQILVETYNEKYQNREEPNCSIKFICDEAANLKINDLASKVSASRSRKIDWTLIFQSERQMTEAYRRDWATIAGNCKHRIYLGSSDYEVLRNISIQTGITYFSRDGNAAPLVSVDELRKMRKEKDYKDALILTGNYIYCAQLPDYERFEFLEEASIEWPQKILNTGIRVYTPEDMYVDYREGRISFVEQGDDLKKADHLSENKSLSEYNLEDIFEHFSEED